MINKASILLCGLLFLAACSNDNEFDEKKKPITPPTDNININANPSNIKEYSRLEMPRLHQGTDTILIHKTGDGIVNYITEWDYAKKSQRWSCYVLDKDYARPNVHRYYSKENK